ncbi:hypothetical protein B0H16DRAFT_1500394 [Mycena metata]|uniref:F-box domain-containing protein n=1 Tax=Mycena metata TaxID=1033252 RepID=A0AAD7K9J7_9AGAR|nr:hypothetical protein B0H16DRAFT_1500394 [Mycena metata]
MQLIASLDPNSESGPITTIQPTETLRPESCLASPLLNVPPEIIAEIFLHFLPSYPEPPPVVAPLLLSRICRHWRQIALSTPLLWRAIHMPLREHELPEARARKLNLLDTWLSRSGDCSLSISLHYILHPAFNSESSPTVSQFFDAIVRHASRWEYLDLHMPFEDLSSIQGDMPRLRDLTFGPCELPKNDDPTVFQLFDCSPQLTKVVLTECFVPLVIHLPWSQITHLEGLCLYAHECGELLSAATNLVHCIMALCGGSDVPIPPIPPHLHIRTLILHVAEETHIYLDVLLNRITLPALCTLRFTEHAVSESGPLTAVGHLLSRSQCALE